jgi:hypothetical protein
MLRCQRIEVKNYDFTLGRLVYESLRCVQDIGIKSLTSIFVGRYPKDLKHEAFGWSGPSSRGESCVFQKRESSKAYYKTNRYVKYGGIV